MGAGGLSAPGPFVKCPAGWLQIIYTNTQLTDSSWCRSASCVLTSHAQTVPLLTHTLQPAASPLHVSRCHSLLLCLHAVTCDEKWLSVISAPSAVRLLSVPWGTFPSDQREHQPAGPLVVHRPDPHPGGHRHLADETSQELLRGQEAGVTFCLGVCVFGCVCVCACVVSLLTDAVLSSGEGDLCCWTNCSLQRKPAARLHLRWLLMLLLLKSSTTLREDVTLYLLQRCFSALILTEFWHRTSSLTQQADIIMNWKLLLLTCPLLPVGVSGQYNEWMFLFTCSRADELISCLM